MKAALVPGHVRWEGTRTLKATIARNPENLAQWKQVGNPRGQDNWGGFLEANVIIYRQGA